MLSHTRFAAAALSLAAFGASCRPTAAPASAVDSAMASCIPAGTVVLGGVDLNRLRASPVYAKLPAIALTLAEPLRDAAYLLVAFNGNAVFSIARGNFREAPPGATLLGPNLALAGSPELVQAAIAQRRTGTPGESALLDAAATAKPVWIFARGSATLPFGGNLANLNRLLHLTAHTTVAAALGEHIELTLTAACGSPERAREFEETLRAMTSMAAAANPLLSGVHVSRQDRTVLATLSAAPDTLNLFFGTASR